MAGSIGRHVRVAVGLMAVSLSLAGCAGGTEALAPQDDIVPLVATTTEPGAVTRGPLLPPVPAAPTAQTAPTGETWSTAAPPLQYDQPYSDDEQAKIQSDLLKAAARAKVN